MHVMKSMELTDEEQLDAVMPLPMSERPKYPYGLKICLTEKELEKLGVDPSEAKVGGTIHLFAMARITSVSENETDDGKQHRVEAQIEELGVQSEDAENEKAKRPARKKAPIYDD